MSGARSAAPTRESVLAILDTVMDPEVPVLSVRELGIVRDVVVRDDASVTVTITPTYSGCPAMRVIEDDIRAALAAADVPDVRIETVYSPPWTSDWIPAGARAKLKASGIAPPSAREEGALVQLVRARRAPPCPYCDSRDTEVRSEFGSTACKSICWCRRCGEPFEEFKSF